MLVVHELFCHYHNHSYQITDFICTVRYISLLILMLGEQYGRDNAILNLFLFGAVKLRHEISINMVS